MIREGRATDLPQISAVRTSVRENLLTAEDLIERGITIEGVRADMEAGDIGCWVAEDGGRVVAFSMADRRNGNLWALFTHPDHERRGHGCVLMACAERWLKARGHDQIFLETDAAAKARAFYERHGWRVIVGETRDPEDVKMAKNV